MTTENTKLTERQKRFCDYYIETGNGADSARRAGYKAKDLKVIASENLTKPNIKAYISKILKGKNKERIAAQDEVLEYFTRVMRGETISSVVVVEGLGDGISKAKEFEKKPDEKERLDAAKQLAKRYGLDKRIDLDERRLQIQEKQAQDLDEDIVYEVVENEED